MQTKRRAATLEPSFQAGPSTTKHAQLTEAITAETRAGRLRVGDMLPSEPQLSLRYGVSRQTVRAALRTLQKQGLVGSQRGVESTVLDTRVDSRYSQSFSSAEDLLQYATSTPVRVIAREQVELGPEQAARFGCKPGEHWWRVRTLRTNPSGRAVIACSDIHIPLAFASVLDELPKSRQPIFALIAQRFNQPSVEIAQELTCIARLSREECELLKLPPRSPGLEITRRYIGRDGRVLEVARSVHPPETFRYPMRVQLRTS
jgi:GntR family transcriptional regulator